MKGFTLSQKKVKELKLLHKKQKDRRSADRIKAIVLLGTGWSTTQVSEALLLDSETLRNYLKKYREGKIEKVLETNHKGKVAQLSDDQKQELKKHLTEHTYSDVKSIIAYVKNTYNATFKQTRMREILGELGFTYKKRS